ncbi:hypothetical protein Tco_0679372 [Tanacetum coccineum]|uniref:Uncharacterized protein n=1 Tax=Tanacetum coccineum TaxID=301880 RepID=A0ABQ4XIL3_9ASTR
MSTSPPRPEKRYAPATIDSSNDNLTLSITFNPLSHDPKPYAPPTTRSWVVSSVFYRILQILQSSVSDVQYGVLELQNTAYSSLVSIRRIRTLECGVFIFGPDTAYSTYEYGVLASVHIMLLSSSCFEFSFSGYDVLFL